MQCIDVFGVLFFRFKEAFCLLLQVNWNHSVKVYISFLVLSLCSRKKIRKYNVMSARFDMKRRIVDETFI